MLWWAGLAPSGNFVARLALANLSLIALVLGLEGRVIFRSFNQYIHLSAPWNYITITLALYGTGAAVVNFLIAADSSKWMRESLESITQSERDHELAAIPTWVGVVFILSVTAGCVAVGMTTLALVAALTAAAGLVLFSESRLLRDYLLFAIGVTGTLAWFLKENFWFLDVRTGALHMRHLCALLTLEAFLTFLVPGVVMTCGGGRGGGPPGAGRFGSGSDRGGSALLGCLMVLQVALLTYLERGLTYGSRLSQYNEGDFSYPPYLVLLTSVLG